jgi:TRAP-type mannitol/chloroaromatic compound transport system permease large subunit
MSPPLKTFFLLTALVLLHLSTPTEAASAAACAFSKSSAYNMQRKWLHLDELQHALDRSEKLSHMVM